MAGRRIGQESLGLVDRNGGCGSTLDDLAAVIDWAPVERDFAGISSAAKGEPGWPPLGFSRRCCFRSGTTFRGSVANRTATLPGAYVPSSGAPVEAHTDGQIVLGQPPSPAPHSAGQLRPRDVQQPRKEMVVARCGERRVAMGLGEPMKQIGRTLAVVIRQILVPGYLSPRDP